MFKIIEFIGFLHDLGKYNQEFQSKLINKSLQKDIFRHELVSIFILDFILNHHLTEKTYKLDFFKYINETYIKNNNLIISTSDSELLKLIKLIVLTHHKPISFSSSDTSSIYNAFSINEMFKTEKNSYINSSKNKNIFNKSFLLIPFDVLSETKNKYNDLSTIHFSDEFFFSFKFSLIAADHFVSGNFNTCCLPKKESLAKHISIKYEPSDIYKMFPIKTTQYLYDHLSNVSIYSNKFLEFFNNETLLEHISNKYTEYSTHINFIWQNDSINFVRTNFSKNSTGFFVVAAKTGAGKTKFCAKLINELSDKTRVSVLLGLRNLTLQTYQTYKDIFKNDVCLTIGSQTTSNIEISDNEEILESELIDTYSEDDSLLIPSEPFIEHFYQQNKEFLLKPILVSTIDMMINAVNFTNSKFKSSLYRLKHSDLILDEIDNYDLNELFAICKLVYLSGLFKRRVILSTATANKHLIDVLHKAYISGTNNNDKCYILSDVYNNLTDNILDEFDIFSSLLESNQKHMISIKDISIDNIFEYTKTLFNLHHENVYNQKFAAGLIRIPHISNLLNVFLSFEEHFNSSDDTIYFPVVYHSQMFLLYRAHLESLLDDSLNRKTGTVADSKLFQILREKYPNKNICFILIATSIEEIGRDHDFDFAIIEPSSTRSIIQTAGRVLRHRDKLISEPNIYIMNQNFRLQNSNHIVYTKPGYESPVDKISLKDKSILSVAPYLTNGLSQKYVVNPSESEHLSYFESNVLKTRLNNFFTLMQNEKFFFFYKDEYSDSKTGLHIHFRKDNNSSRIYQIKNNELYEKENNDLFIINRISSHSIHKDLFILYDNVPINETFLCTSLKDIKTSLHIFNRRFELGLFQKHQLS